MVINPDDDAFINDTAINPDDDAFLDDTVIDPDDDIADGRSCFSFLRRVRSSLSFFRSLDAFLDGASINIIEVTFH